MRNWLRMFWRWRNLRVEKAVLKKLPYRGNGERGLVNGRRSEFLF